MMNKGAVLVDISVDQGGCIETTRPTTHDNPVYIIDDIVHYCVANMPGAVAKTSTFALTNATLPYALKLANLGYREATKQDPALMKGLNVFKGNLVSKPVADAQGLESAVIKL
jgi:alanine dehydrogenase